MPVAGCAEAGQGCPQPQQSVRRPPQLTAAPAALAAVQGGDPTGTGKGGESVWGPNFKVGGWGLPAGGCRLGGASRGQVFSSRFCPGAAGTGCIAAAGCRDRCLPVLQGEADCSTHTHSLSHCPPIPNPSHLLPSMPLSSPLPAALPPPGCSTRSHSPPPRPHAGRGGQPAAAQRARCAVHG